MKQCAPAQRGGRGEEGRVKSSARTELSSAKQAPDPWETRQGRLTSAELPRTAHPTTQGTFASAFLREPSIYSALTTAGAPFGWVTNTRANTSREVGIAKCQCLESEDMPLAGCFLRQGPVPDLSKPHYPHL